MTCKCGREIANVPDHLKGLAQWVCRECSNAPPTNGLVTLTATGELAVESDVRTQKLTAGHAA